MERREFLFLSGSSLLLGCGTIGSLGCGTVFHRDRIGQPHSRDIDWKVAALNGLGLAFFFVPGVVAFAVDFYTGAIYLPVEKCHGGGPGYPPAEPTVPGGFPQSEPAYEPIPTVPYNPPRSPSAVHHSQSHSESDAPSALHRVQLSPECLDQPRIQAAVAQHLGRPLKLSDDGVRISPLTRLDDFAQACRRHREDPRFGLRPAQLFRRNAAA